MRPRTILNLLALTVVVACMAAPVATASISQRGDLVSPDARDAQPPPTVVIGSDLRSPDARDAAIGRTTSDAPTTLVVNRESSSGFDWGDASIGAGVMLAIVAAGGGVTVLLMHRRRTPAVG